MLIDSYMPSFEFRDYHEATVLAEPSQTYGVMRSLDLSRSRLIRLILAIRELPARIRDRGRGPVRPPAALGSLVDSAVELGWEVLEESPGHELVAGAVTKPWVADVAFRGLPGAQFVAFSDPGFAKIVWNIAVRDLGEGCSLVSTETRVAATDPVSRKKLRWYWFALSPGIRLIRRIAMRLVKLEAQGRNRPNRTPT